MNRDALVKELADYMVKEGAASTESGSYTFYLDELADIMYQELLYAGEQTAEMWLLKHSRDIVDAIDEHEEILSETWLQYDDNGIVEAFDLNFGLAYCPNASWEGLEEEHIDFLAEKYHEDPSDDNFQAIVEAFMTDYWLDEGEAEARAREVISEPVEGEDDQAPSNYTQALELLADVLCDYDDKIVTWGDDWDEDELKSFTEPRDKLAKAIELLSRPTEMVRVNYSVHTEEEDDDDVLTDVSEAKALDFLIGLADTDSSIWSVERVPKGTPSPWGKWFPPYID